MDDILPCPCCGSKPKVEQVPPDQDDENAGGYYIECSNPLCGITTRLRWGDKVDPVPLLVETWNRRAPQEGKADEAPKIAVGQIWKECDPRVTRMVKIVGIQRDKVAIRGTQTNRLSYASKSRFHGRSGGYALVSDATPPATPRGDGGEPDNTKVICPSCTYQFRAIPVQVQNLMLDAGFQPPFTAPPTATDGFVRVPKEPTEEWLDDISERLELLDSAFALEIHAAVVAAAPQSGDGFAPGLDASKRFAEKYKVEAYDATMQVLKHHKVPVDAALNTIVAGLLDDLAIATQGGGKEDGRTIYMAPVSLIGPTGKKVRVRFVSRHHLKDKPTEANPSPIRVLIYNEIEQVVGPISPPSKAEGE